MINAQIKVIIAIVGMAFVNSATLPEDPAIGIKAAMLVPVANNIGFLNCSMTSFAATEDAMPSSIFR